MVRSRSIEGQPGGLTGRDEDAEVGDDVPDKLQDMCTCSSGASCLLHNDVMM